MTPNPTDRRIIQRILLALDSSVPSQVALEEAARLARRLGAELNALFIEDTSLLELAQSPFARHFNVLSRAVESVNMPLMEARLLAQARERRRAFETVAKRAGVRSSFRTMRGRVAEVVIAAAVDQDLLLIGWATNQNEQEYLASTRLRGSREQRPSTLQAIAVGSQRPVLLLRQGEILNRPVAVVFDGGAGDQRALMTAAALAAIARQKLVVLLAGDESLAELAAAILKDSPAHDVEYVTLRQRTVGAIAAARGQTACGVVVLDAESPLLTGDGGSPLAAFPCPVLLSR